ncbi:hypothetical protein ACF0H5_010934 [Mactra antiquata]
MSRKLGIFHHCCNNNTKTNMNTLTMICLAACMVLASGFKLQRERRGASEHFIEYLIPKCDVDMARDSVSQKIVMEDEEVRLSDAKGMDVVIDYRQSLLFVKRQNDKSCIMMSTQNVMLPTLDTIKDLIKLSTSMDSQLQFPSLTLELDLIKSNNQEQPQLSPLSKELCGGTEVVVVEQKPKVVQSVERAMVLHEMRPKRESYIAVCIVTREVIPANAKLTEKAIQAYVKLTREVITANVKLTEEVTPANVKLTGEVITANVTLTREVAQTNVK